MRRREFIAGLSGAVAWPLAARAQQQRPVIGYLGALTQREEASELGAFREGLKKSGFVEGSNLAIEYRWAEGQNDRLPALAADLVSRKVAAIASFGGVPGARAAKAATDTIPIVFFTGANPVALGLVSSLSRPGGNLTGVTALSDELGPKRLEIMHALLPAATEFVLIVDPTNPNSEPQSTDMRAAAGILGLNVHILPATRENDFAAAFETAVRLRAGGLIIGPNLFSVDANASANQQLALLAARHAMPTISFGQQFTAAGGLMSYGSGDVADAQRTVGVYVGRILKGEKPADLPVQQATRIELVINLKTAKLLGLTVPLTLLGRADRVIE
jgi:putative tryptophan/tyrosine transport system substrate-binding protein